jgi:hypothetical protein
LTILTTVTLASTSNALPDTPKYVGAVLTLSNTIFLPIAYSPALICFGRERGRWIPCNYPTVLKEKIHGETERVQPALSVG